MKKFLGGMVVLLLVAGVGIPALFGYVQSKASDIGVNNLVGCSADINSSIFSNSCGRYWTGSGYYIVDVVSMDDYQYSLLDMNNYESSQIGHHFTLQTNLNRSALSELLDDGKLDKIKVMTNIDNWQGIESVKFQFWIPNDNTYTMVHSETIDINDSTIQNTSFITFDVPITPQMYLKFKSDECEDVRMDIIMPVHCHMCQNCM